MKRDIKDNDGKKVGEVEDARNVATSRLGFTLAGVAIVCGVSGLFAIAADKPGGMALVVAGPAVALFAYVLIIGARK